jgi:hypothetical protein
LQKQQLLNLKIWDRYFRQKILEKNGVFDSKQSLILKKIDHNIGFWEKHRFFRRKFAKIAENCDDNIDPWTEMVTAQKIIVPEMQFGKDWVETDLRGRFKHGANSIMYKYTSKNLQHRNLLSLF